MRIRTLSQLVDWIDEDLAKRKRELTDLKSLVLKSRAHQQSATIRCAVCLLYAHWEGFVKNGSKAYLNYISFLGMKYDELGAGILALCVRGMLNQAESTSRVKIHKAIIDFMQHGMNEKAEVPWDTSVGTYGNLTHDILEDILTVIGSEYSQYQTKELLIDVQLLRRRNIIAHGDWIDCDVLDYIDLHDKIVGLLDSVRTDIQNAAAQELFRRSVRSEIDASTDLSGRQAGS